MFRRAHLAGGPPSDVYNPLSDLSLSVITLRRFEATLRLNEMRETEQRENVRPGQFMIESDTIA